MNLAPSEQPVKKLPAPGLCREPLFVASVEKNA